MPPDLSDPAIPRLVVTGHPNHELAIFGFVQRARPHLLFLTDGEGQERVDESRRALAAIGVLDRANFLGWQEQTLYDALLELDVEVTSVARRGSARCTDRRRAATGDLRKHRALQSAARHHTPDRTCRRDRSRRHRDHRISSHRSGTVAGRAVPPAALSHRSRVVRDLSRRHELENKLHARDHEYRSLRRTTASVAGVSRECARTEVFAHTTETLPTPGRDHVLRYEWRARLLQAHGEIARVITFADHFVPVTTALARAVQLRVWSPSGARP